MTKITKSFSIAYEGWDLNAKTLSNLTKGTPLSFKRIEDELDTYEIVICYKNIEIDMLSYEESLSIAPYLDMDLLNINLIEIDKVTLTKGKTNAQNITKIDLNIEIEYNEEYLELYSSIKGDVLLCQSNTPLSMAIITLNDYEEEIISQPYLNQYTFSIDIDADSQFLFEEVDFSEDNAYFYNCEMLLNEDFSKCKIKSYTQNESQDIANLILSDFEKQTFLELVNHYRIFKDEEILSPKIED